MRSLLLAILLIGIAACLPAGQKLLSLEVKSEGEVVLFTAFDVRDTSTEAEMWDSAGEVPFSTEVNTIQPSDADPLRAEIEGSVEVRIHWTQRVMESAVTLDGLDLVRSDAESDDWHLPADEVRRAKAAAGL